jgi:hypothetical protein
MTKTNAEQASLGEAQLSHEQVEALLGFLGYGDPSGPYWFVGIEERGVGDAATLWQELQVRAKHLEPIEDLKRAQEHAAFASNFTVGQYVPTWVIMSKIVLRLNGEPDWQNRSRTQQYQAKRLGRHGGETFLADVLPLPAGNVEHWPYTTLFANKQIYREQVLPVRIARIRELLERHRPAYVFCYGKGYWDQYRRLFPEVTEYEQIGGFALMGRTPSGSLVVLTPFFRSDAMGHARIDELARRLREDRFVWHETDIVIEPPTAPLDIIDCA